jgi:hypothetical protein
MLPMRFPSVEFSAHLYANFSANSKKSRALTSAGKLASDADCFAGPFSNGRATNPVRSPQAIHPESSGAGFNARLWLPPSLYLLRAEREPSSSHLPSCSISEKRFNPSSSAGPVE